MNKFYVQHGQFWLNGQPQLIQAGELHYFRIPQDQWAHRLGLLKTADFNAVAMYIPWLWHQLAEDVSDFDGHSHPMRDLAGFLDLAAEMGLWIIARPGPYIMAESINEGIPPWVFSNYPQVAFVSQDQKVQNVVSYMHPDFLACVRKWYRAIFEVLTPHQVTRGGNIIMIQLDNEMGMIQWVRNILDTNPDTVTRFAGHLQNRYEDQLVSRYPTDHLADFLRQTILHPTESYGAKVMEDYRYFYRDYLHEYTTFLWAEAQTNGMEVLPIINIHGFANGGKTFPIGISQLVKVMGIEGMLSATDVYPGHIGEGTFHQLLLVNEMTKGLHYKEQALFSVEFQAGGNQDFGTGQTSLYDLHSRLCISSGMRAINHYLFFDGENDPVLSPVKRHDWGHPVRKDGTLRRHFFRYPKLSRVLAAYGTDLVVSRPQTATTIGFILDYFMTEINNAFTQEAANIITHQRDVVLFDMIARGLALTHRPFDAIELSCGELDVSQTPLCWVMIEKQCSAVIQQKLVDYVKQGGKLILAGRMCQEDFDHTPCTILKDTLGITHIESDAPFVERRITAFNYHDVPVWFAERYTGEFDEQFASSGDGQAVGFVKTVGKGQVMMLGAAMAANILEDLDIVHQVALKMGCQPLFQLTDWADVRLSRGPNGKFLFMNNYQDDPVETIIKCDNEDLFGGGNVHLPARAGLILPLDWQVTKDVMVHYVTSEVVGIVQDGSTLTLKTAQNEFTAELTVSGYQCDDAITLSQSGQVQRIQIQGREGEIVLRNS